MAFIMRSGTTMRMPRFAELTLHIVRNYTVSASGRWVTRHPTSGRVYPPNVDHLRSGGKTTLDNRRWHTNIIRIGLGPDCRCHDRICCSGSSDLGSSNGSGCRVEAHFALCSPLSDGALRRRTKIESVATPTPALDVVSAIFAQNVIPHRHDVRRDLAIELGIDTNRPA